MPNISFAQISDCHLFADKNACHHQAYVYQHLCAVLNDIKNTPDLSFIIFTGDLTQDHSEASYRNFVEAIKENNIIIPVYFLAGNHDEPKLLNKYLQGAPFVNKQMIESGNWQLLLINSKSATPAGEFNVFEFEQLMGLASNKKPTLLLMHHHPINVGYFIDRHPLTNQQQFWQSIKAHANIKAIACGHIHRAMEIQPTEPQHFLPLYTCPATSIQFDPKADTVKSLNQPPAYRVFHLQENGSIQSNIIQVEL